MRKKLQLWLILFTTFVDMVGFGFLIPILPFYAGSFGASPLQVTLLGSSFAVSQVVFSLVWGKLSDRLGRKQILIASIAFSCLGHICGYLADSFMLLLISRLVAGIGSGNIGILQAMLVDQAPQDKRASYMGYFGAAFSAGLFLGPMVGTLLSKFSTATPYLGAATISLVNLFWIVVVLKNTSNKCTKEVGTKYGSIWKLPRFRSLLLLNLGVGMSFVIAEQVFGLYLEYSWYDTPELRAINRETSIEMLSYFIVSASVINIIFQGTVYSWLTRYFGVEALWKSGILVLATGMILIPILLTKDSTATIFIAAITIAIGVGISEPAINTLLSSSVDSKRTGEAMGLNQSVGAGGRIVGPALAGMLFELDKGLPFLVGGGIVYLVLATSFFLPHCRPICGNRPTHPQSC